MSLLQLGVSTGGTSSSGSGGGQIAPTPPSAIYGEANYNNDFNYNSLQIAGTGSNNANNTSFIDSSTNNFTVTPAGDVTQGTTSPFVYGTGTDPATGYFSGYFDGTGDCVSFTPISALNPGTGDFTLELWVYHQTTSTYQGYYYGGASNCINFRRTDSNTIELSHDSVQSVLITSSTVPSNQWAHVAVTRSSGTVRIFINGVIGGSVSYAGNFSSSGGTGTIGSITTSIYNLTGYISNFRLIVGTALYTANFTVPTTPLTAVSNTQLLTCQNNRFIDNSTNAISLVTNGQAQPTPLNPFGMTAWSGFFDGTGDYLDSTTASVYTFGTGDFTIETWIRFNSIGAYVDIMGTANNTAYLGSGQSGWVFGCASSVMRFGYQSSNTWVFDQNFSVNLATNTWYHVAVTRSGSSIKVFVNGVQVGSTLSNSTNFISTSNTIRVGGGYGSTAGLVNGVLSNVRVVKGTAVYTANFTPPAAPLTAISGTALLTCQSSTFIDNSVNAAAITVNGNTYTGTLNNPFGNPVNYATPPTAAYSGYFDGTNDYVLVAANTNINNLGYEDFTIECWAFLNSSSTDATIVAQNTVWATQNNYTIEVRTGGVFRAFIGDSTAIDINPGINSFPLKQWNHVAIVRRVGTTTAYINGRSVGSSTTAVNLTRNPVTSIGAFSTSGTALSNYWKGYISNFRIVRGTAVYTDNFTPPTAPLTAIPGTVLLTCQSIDFNDASIIRNVITPTNGAAIDTFTPFGLPTSAITPATVGGSGYFDGTGDDLTTPSNAAFTYGTGNFTIEGFFFFTGGVGGSGYSYLFAQGGGTGITSLGVYIQDGVYKVWNGSAVIVGTTAYAQNRWVHIALARSGTTLRLFLNGVLEGTATNSNSIASGSTIGISLGRWAEIGDSNYITGYVSNFRVVKGTAVYTTAFTPLTAPVTAIANTSLLLNFANGAITDATGKNNIQLKGNTVISTVKAKYGSGSVYFDGSGDYLQIPAAPDLYLSPAGTTASNLDFTIEFWFNPNSVATASQCLWLRRSSQNPRGIAIVTETSTLAVYLGTSSWQVQIASSVGSVTANTWNHCALTRAGTEYRVFLNGVLVGTSTPTAFVISDDTSPIWIGNNGTEASQGPFTGYMQDIRFTVGKSRYAYSFPVPSALFTNYYTTAAAPTTDTYGSYTTALLPGTGTNLSKNNAVTDASTNAYAVSTGAGTVTLGTLSPYSENGWSAFFDGSGDYYTVPYSSSINILSGDFTVEGWVNATLIGTGSRQIGGQWQQTTGQGGWQLGIDTSGFITVAFGAATEATGIITSSVAIAVNTWYHIALVRNGSVFTLYINGVSRGTYTSAATRAALTSIPTTFGNWLSSSGTFPASGSADFRGYLADYRIVKGTAVYTSNFTPPTAPLTAISGTGLLCFASPYAVDLSGNNNTFTITGSTRTTPQTPYPATAAYSAAVNGGSMFFDGSTYLALSSGIAIPATGTFTIECWLYITASATQILVSQYTSSDPNRSTFIIDNVSGYKLSFNPGGIVGSTVIPLQQWNHCAVTRDSSNNLRIFLNGKVDATSANYTSTIQQTQTRISGFANSPAYLISDGYMAGLRITNTAVYTAAFTPPTAPPTAIAGTTLLLNFTDNTGPRDATGRSIVYSSGDASISTAVTDPWSNNNGVLYFPGTTDAMLLNSIGSDANNVSPLYAPQGDFTWEAWIYPTAVGTAHIVTWGYNNASSSYAGIYLAYFANLQCTLQVSSTGSSNIADLRAGIFTLNRWQHVAVSRLGSNLRLFIDGALLNEASTTADLWAGTATTPDYGSFTLGQRNVSGPQNFSGYMSNVRFTRNRARYWSPFTPPSAPFPLY